MTAEPTPEANAWYPWITLLIGISVFSIAFVLWYPNWTRTRARAQMSACQANLKVLAMALASHARRNGGRYPDELEALIPGNDLEFIPTCPCRQAYYRGGLEFRVRATVGPDYAYTVQHHPEKFSVACKGEHPRADSGAMADNSLYPRYESDKGLLEHP